MQHLKGLQKYMKFCIGALILIHLPMMAYLFEFTYHLRPYVECTLFCLYANTIIVSTHVILVAANLVATIHAYFLNGTSGIVKERRGFRMMSIKFTLLAISFVCSSIVEFGLINSPHDFWLSSFIVTRLHFTIEFLAALLKIIAILKTEKRLRHEILSMRPLVAEPMDVSAVTSRWQFLAPPQGREIVRYNHRVPPTSVDRKPNGAFSYIGSVVEEHKKKYPLVTFRPLLKIGGRTFIN